MPLSYAQPCVHTTYERLGGRKALIGWHMQYDVEGWGQCYLGWVIGGSKPTPLRPAIVDCVGLEVVGATVQIKRLVVGFHKGEAVAGREQSVQGNEG